MGRKLNKKWPYKFVEVVWYDICSKDDWVSTTKPCNPMEVHERGWLIFEGKIGGVECIVLASQLAERDEDEMDRDELDKDDRYDMGTHSTIPRGCVHSIREKK